MLFDLGTEFCGVANFPFNVTLNCPNSRLGINYTCPGLSSGWVEFNCSTVFKSPVCRLIQEDNSNKTFLIPINLLIFLYIQKPIIPTARFSHLTVCTQNVLVLLSPAAPGRHIDCIRACRYLIPHFRQN